VVDELGGALVFDEDGFKSIEKVQNQLTQGGVYERLSATLEEGFIHNQAKAMGLEVYVRKLKTNQAGTPDTIYLLKRTVKGADGNPVNYYVEFNRLEVKGLDLITVTLNRGFNIGIAKKNNSFSSSESPTEWSEIIE